MLTSSFFCSRLALGLSKLVKKAIGAFVEVAAGIKRGRIRFFDLLL